MSNYPISVIIPCYNRASLVGETLENLLRQSLPPTEIIVVDDGSTDASVRVIQSFGSKVKLIQQANQGPGVARNAGLRVATGEYIQFQDSDDLFSLNKLEAQAQVLEQTGADIVFSPWVKLNVEGHNVHLENHVLQQAMPPFKLSLPCWWLRGWSTVFQSLMFRKSFLDRIVGYRTDLMPSEDTELFFRILTDSPKVVFTAEPLMLYREHTLNKITQDQGTSTARRVADWAHCLAYMIERWKKCEFKPDQWTRSIFLAGVQKHLGYLRRMPNPPEPLIKLLFTETQKMPGGWLAAVGFWLRGSEFIRLRLSGSRWMDAYQAGPPSEHQLRLIRELGFFVNGVANN
jgi:glycosyltransferase involved in cell wall biosynthesis